MNRERLISVQSFLHILSSLSNGQTRSTHYKVSLRHNESRLWRHIKSRKCVVSQSHELSLQTSFLTIFTIFSFIKSSWIYLDFNQIEDRMNHLLLYLWFCLINIKLNWKSPVLTVSDLITCLGNNAVISISSQKVTYSLIVDCCSLYQL